MIDHPLGSGTLRSRLLHGTLARKHATVAAPRRLFCCGADTIHPVRITKQGGTELALTEAGDARAGRATIIGVA